MTRRTGERFLVELEDVANASDSPAHVRLKLLLKSALRWLAFRCLSVGPAPAHRPLPPEVDDDMIIANPDTGLGELLEAIAGNLDAVAGKVCELDAGERFLLAQRLRRVEADLAALVQDLGRLEHEEPARSH